MNAKKDLIVLTLGMNPLPCLVETYRLCQHLSAKTGAMPAILAIETEQAKAAPIRKILAEKMPVPGGAEWLAPVNVADAFSPTEIRRGLRESSVEWANHDIHLLYTGGTKALAIETFAYLVPQAKVYRYYLNPKNHLLEGELEAIHPPGGGDERMQWNLSLEDLGNLHQVKILPVAEPSTMLVETGRLFFSVVKEPENYNKLKNPDGTNWPHINHADWESARAAIQTEFPLPEARARFREFFDKNLAIELNLYDIVHRNLGKAYGSVAHSVRIHGPGARTEGELDVVAILGYQVVVFSCTMAEERVKCKLKAFEAIHRARQLGGDHARAILLCRVKDGMDLENDIRDDMGLPSPNEAPIRVWDQTVVSGDLERKVRDLLVNLGWRGIN